jgi:hypothetical protein
LVNFALLISIGGFAQSFDLAGVVFSETEIAAGGLK